MSLQTSDFRVINKRIQDLTARMEEYEKSMTQLIPSINNALGSINQQLSAQAEVLEGVVESFGRDKVEAAVKASRERRIQQTMESEKKALEDLRASGELVAVPLVTEKSVIVGREYDADGSVRVPGRVQVAYSRVDPQFQTKLLDQPPGTTFELPNGGKFEVLEVYEVVEKPLAAADDTNTDTKEQ